VKVSYRGKGLTSFYRWVVVIVVVDGDDDNGDDGDGGAAAEVREADGAENRPRVPSALPSVLLPCAQRGRAVK